GVYLQSMRSEATEMRSVARRLAEQNDFAGQAEYLQLSLTRTQAAVLARGGTRPDDALDEIAPAELDLLVRSFQAVQRLTKDPLFDVGSRYGVALMTELRRAGRAEDADRLYQELTARTETPLQIVAAMYVAA